MNVADCSLLLSNADKNCLREMATLFQIPIQEEKKDYLKYDPVGTILLLIIINI